VFNVPFFGQDKKYLHLDSVRLIFNSLNTSAIIPDLVPPLPQSSAE
jgi:hypothetical protein